MISSNQVDVCLSSWKSPGNLTLGLSEQNLVCYGFDKGFEVLQGITLASERQNGKFCSLLIGAAKYSKYLKAT